MKHLFIFTVVMVIIIVISSCTKNNGYLSDLGDLKQQSMKYSKNSNIRVKARNCTIKSTYIYDSRALSLLTFESNATPSPSLLYQIEIYLYGKYGDYWYSMPDYTYAQFVNDLSDSAFLPYLHIYYESVCPGWDSGLPTPFAWSDDAIFALTPLYFKIARDLATGPVTYTLVTPQSIHINFPTESSLTVVISPTIVRVGVTNYTATIDDYMASYNLWLRLISVWSNFTTTDYDFRPYRWADNLRVLIPVLNNLGKTPPLIMGWSSTVSGVFTFTLPGTLITDYNVYNFGSDVDKPISMHAILTPANSKYFSRAFRLGNPMTSPTHVAEFIGINSDYLCQITFPRPSASVAQVKGTLNKLVITSHSLLGQHYGEGMDFYEYGDVNDVPHRYMMDVHQIYETQYSSNYPNLWVNDHIEVMCVTHTEDAAPIVTFYPSAYLPYAGKYVSNDIDPRKIVKINNPLYMPFKRESSQGDVLGSFSVNIPSLYFYSSIANSYVTMLLYIPDFVQTNDNSPVIALPFYQSESGYDQADNKN